MNSTPRPSLSWLHNLHEAGPPITRLASDELEIIDEIAKLKKQIAARKRDIAENRREAERKVRKLWSASEIAEAKARPVSA